MELESTQSNTIAKLPLLKQVAETTTNDAGTSTTIIPGPVTIEETAKLKNDVKARNLEKIHGDDLEEMDLKWQLALVSMRAKRFFYKTGKKITINESDIDGYDKSKVECFNCHKMGHFTRECRVPRNQEYKTKTQETTRKTVNVEDTSSKEMVAIYETGFDWSYMAVDEALTNMAFMALSDSEDIKIKDSEIVVIKSKLEKISNEKNALDVKIGKFSNASQSLDKLIGSQIIDNSKTGLGYVSYNDVPPSHTGRFSPLIIDLSHTGLPEFSKPSVKSYGVTPIEVVTQTYSVKISAPVKENIGVPLIEEWESDEEDEVESPPEKEKKNVEPSVNKRERMVNGTNHSRVNHNATTVPKAMLTRTGLKPVNSVRPVNPKGNFFKKINIANEKVNTARPNSAVLNVVRANKGKAIKASACWV
nr:hypothetical protein [Tanacetum cinerariifolium]